MRSKVGTSLRGLAASAAITLAGATAPNGAGTWRRGFGS
jgi:hypothetical protein